MRNEVKKYTTRGRSVMQGILAICIMVFLFWNNSDVEVNNWDKLNRIIDESYTQTFSDKRELRNKDDL